MEADLTIIIPVYNKEEVIEKSVNSILSQTQKPKEIILIDDQSTDKSFEIIKQIKDRNNDEKIKIKAFKNKINRGVSYTRNYGLGKSEGKYVTFFDAGDEYRKDFVEKMYQKIQNKYDVVYSPHATYDGTAVREAYFDKVLWRTPVKNYLSNKAKGMTNCWMISNKFLVENDIYFKENLSLGEDILFFTEVLAKARNVGYLNEPLTIYYDNPRESLSSNTKKNLMLLNDWIFQVDKVLLTHSLEEERELLWGYKYPATIVNNILNTEQFDSLFSAVELENYYRMSKNHFRFVNGLRSVKLFFQIIKLRKKI